MRCVFQKALCGVERNMVMEACKEATQMRRGRIQGSSGEGDKNTE